MVRNSDKKIILIDFGIARTITPGSDTIKTSIGTPAFSPEEIFQGRPEPRSDLYSLGATMHCLLTGLVPVTPFAFKPVRQVNPAVSVELEAIVMCALAMNASDRYASARHLKDALKNLIAGRVSTVVQVQPPAVPYQNIPTYSGGQSIIPSTVVSSYQPPPPASGQMRPSGQLPSTVVSSYQPPPPVRSMRPSVSDVLCGHLSASLVGYSCSSVCTPEQCLLIRFTDHTTGIISAGSDDTTGNRGGEKKGI
jgi:serine/threonine protein kinase